MARLFGLVAAVLVTLGSVPATCAHPQDSPDCEIGMSITDEAVFLNVRMNLVYVDEVAPFSREDYSSLHELEHAAAEESLEEYFRTRNRVEIDGIEVSPEFMGFQFSRADLAMLPLFPVTGMRALWRIEVSVRYSCMSPPHTVKLTWSGYPPSNYAPSPGEEVEPMLLEVKLTAEGVQSVVPLAVYAPTLTWEATGKTLDERLFAVPEAAEAEQMSVPVASLAIGVLALGYVGVTAVRRTERKGLRMGLALVLGAAGAGATLGVGRVEMAKPWDAAAGVPSEEQALAIFQPLHGNIYRAFDFASESDVYDALSRSVDGPLLDGLYNEVYQSLISHEDGGAVARVQQVELVGAECLARGLLPPDDAPGFTVRASWRVTGVVIHWGHSHERVNEYEADYSVRKTGAGWRITSYQVRAQKRVESRPLDSPGGTPAPIPGEI